MQGLKMTIQCLRPGLMRHRDGQAIHAGAAVELEAGGEERGVQGARAHGDDLAAVVELVAGGRLATATNLNLAHVY
jgi:hypothetical protein